MTAVVNKARLPRLRTRQEAVEYFQTHQRSRGKDLQIDTVHSLSWNCDGTRLACGSRSKRICIMQVDNSCRLTPDFNSSIHNGSIDQVAFQHANPYIFASASEDRSVCFWDTRQPKKHTMIETKVPNSYVNWSICDRYIVFHGRDDKITVVDSKNLKVYKTYEMNREATEMMPHSNGKHLFVATGSGKVDILSMPELEPVLSLQAHSAQSTLAALDITKDGRKMAVGGNDAIVSIWDLESMSCETSMARMDYAIRSVAFSSDGTLLASGSEDHFLDLSWSDDGQRVYNLPTDEGTYSIAWHPRHLVMAYSCESTDNRGRGGSDAIRLFGLSG